VVVRVPFLLSRSLVAALVLLLGLAPSVTAQLYQWTDNKGETHFGQGPDSVPPRYRARARIVGNVDSPPAPSGPSTATVSEGVTRVAFSPGRRIMVEALINGQGPVGLLLDTGADATVITPDALIALRVSYRHAQQVPLRGIGGTATGYLVVLESLEVGGARVAPMRVVSHDAEFEPGVAGLLGRDFLSHFRVSIDNTRGIVELAPK
jgi:predicted aspartyl protease